MYYILFYKCIVFLPSRYQHGIFRRLVKAASERDLERVARDIIATMWLVLGQLWFGYEVHGLENLPEGPALIVYYHGALPVDYYFFLAYMTVHRQRTPLSVVDLFMFKLWGVGTILKMVRATPGKRIFLIKGFTANFAETAMPDFMVMVPDLYR